MLGASESIPSLNPRHRLQWYQLTEPRSDVHSSMHIHVYAPLPLVGSCTPSIWLKSQTIRPGAAQLTAAVHTCAKALRVLAASTASSAGTHHVRKMRLFETETTNRQ
jgi:hypothetical protein